MVAQGAPVNAHENNFLHFPLHSDFRAALDFNMVAVHPFKLVIWRMSNAE